MQPPPDPQMLLDHAGALRRLALGLTGGDPHAAQDLVQETWVRALERPPQHAERLRGWLATVLAGVASKSRRTDTRRTFRERRAAHSELQPSEVELAQDLEERKRVLRRVSDALLELEEPYQSTLLLRYYEGHSPSEIARLTRAPLATVKSRLQRGLTRLRAGLDETQEQDERSWLSALCALTGVEYQGPAGISAGTATSVATGALIMSQKAKYASLTLLLLLIGVGLWHSLQPEPREQLDESLALSPPATPAHPLRDATDAPRSPGTALASSRPAAHEPALLASSADREHELRVVVHDQDDLPLEGARVYAAPRDCPFNAVGRTDADGQLVLRWRAKAGRMELSLFATHEAAGPSGLRRVESRGGRHTRTLALQLRRASIANDDDRHPDHRLDTDLAPSQTPLNLELAARHDPEGRLVFVDPWTGASRPHDRGALASPDPPAERRVEPLDEREARRTSTALRGTISDEAGAPAADVLIMAHHADGIERTRSDELGAYAIDGLPPGDLHLRAGGGDHTVLEADFVGRAGLAVFWNPHLPRSEGLHGRVVDPDGGSGERWVVELSTDEREPARADTTACNAEGEFAFNDVPAGSYLLSVLSASDPGGIPVLVDPRARTGRENELRFDARKLPDASIEVLLEDAGGRPVDDGLVRLWTRAGPEGARGVRLGSIGDGRYRYEGLAPGKYEVETSRPGGSWKMRGVSVKAGHRLELDVIRLQREGRFILAAPERDEPVRWTLLQDDRDIEQFVAEWESTGEFEHALRPGSFVLRSGARELRFSVRAGQATRVGP